MVYKSNDCLIIDDVINLNNNNILLKAFIINWKIIQKKYLSFLMRLIIKYV